jgi:tRNA A-37 threonylcarbamoyl transferase component Bud32
MTCGCEQAQDWILLETLAESRTVRVEKMRDTKGLELVRKSYSFPTTKDRLRGMMRGTLFGKSKAERELHNLALLHQAQVPAVTGVRACVNRNALGFVTDSHLITEASRGTTLAQLLKDEQPPSTETWQSLGRSICRMHQVGFWHRGLAPRNLLILDQEPLHRWLDPAKSQLFPRGITQAARADDLLRFWFSIHELVTQEHKDAFEQAYGQEGTSNPDTIWPAIPKAKRAATEQVLLRDAARFEESR